MRSANAVQITDQTFTPEVENFSGVTLVDFWAPWCGPCRVTAPIFDQLAAKYKDNPQVKFAQVDVDECLETQQRFHIMSIPNFKVFLNGMPVGEENQAIGLAQMEELLMKGLNKLPKAGAAA